MLLSLPVIFLQSHSALPVKKLCIVKSWVAGHKFDYKGIKAMFGKKWRMWKMKTYSICYTQHERNVVLPKLCHQFSKQGQCVCIWAAFENHFVTWNFRLNYKKCWLMSTGNCMLWAHLQSLISHFRAWNNTTSSQSSLATIYLIFVVFRRHFKNCLAATIIMPQ